MEPIPFSKIEMGESAPPILLLRDDYRSIRGCIYFRYNVTVPAEKLCVLCPLMILWVGYIQMS